MRVIIPAKASSERVPNKNWRYFANGLSLVDVNIQSLLRAGFSSSDIHVSCEDRYRLDEVQSRWGITPLVRPSDLCGNDVPLTTWIRSICNQLPGDDDIAWSQVCDPLFRGHREVVELWPTVRERGYDSISVVYSLRSYLMDERQCPIGWQWGEWHTPSQNLPQFYRFPFTFSILTRSAIDRTGYHVGANPFWFVSSGRSIDIDTQFDFDLASYAYLQK